MDYISLIIRRKGVPLLLLLLLAGCTSNPIGDGNTIKDKTVVSGRVTYADGSAATDVFVWMENLQLAANTDANGAFSLSLPAPQSQPGGGLNGIFRIYTYLANYAIDTARVALRDGEILFSQENVNGNGSLNNPLQLHKVLDISTELLSQGRYRNEQILVTCKTRLQAAPGTSLSILSTGNPAVSGEFISTALIQRIDDPLEDFLRVSFGSNGQHALHSRIIGDQPVEFVTTYAYFRCALPVGEFRLVPFVWIQQPGLPEALVQALGVQYETLSLSYIKLPFSGRLTGSFEVEPEILDESHTPCN